MLKGYKILTSFCVICATLYGGAYGAASVRSGTTGRAGSLRTLGAGTTASVKATATSAQPGPSVSGEESDGANTARMAHLTGLGDSKISGKLSLPSAASSQTINELRQAIEQLRSDYEALGNQYDNLSGDVSDVYNTAQVARAAATNNTNTLTVVRSDLNDAKSDIEDLKENGLFNAERVAGTVENVLADKNYATQSQLAVTDAVARGAVQPNQLPQKLNELGVADKDYVDSAVANGMNEDQVSTIVGGAIANTMSNYLTEAQTRSAIRNATENKVDKSYVDTQLVNSVYNRATYDYVDNKVATGMNEDKVSNIVGEVLGDSLDNYYTKGETTNVIQDAIENKVDKGQFNNAVSDIQGAMGNMATTAYVDNAIANLDLDLDENVVKGIVEQYNYMNQSDVNAVVNNRLNNYYTKGETNTAINNVRQGLVEQNYFNNTIANMNSIINNLAPKSWVTTTIENMDKGLSADEVETMISAKGYKDTQGVKDIVESYGYKTAAEVAAAIAEQMPDIDIQYDSNNNQLKFRDKNGAWQTIDMRGLNGQDGAKVNLRRNNDMIQWQHEGDGSAWNDLLSVSDLAGPAGKSVQLQVDDLYGLPNILQYRQTDGDWTGNWTYLYNLNNLSCAPEITVGAKNGGCYKLTIQKKKLGNNGCVNDGAEIERETCDGVAGEGGTLTDDQINNLLAEYLKESVANSRYAVKSTEDKFGNMDNKSTVTEFVGSKLGNLNGQTVADYVDTHTPTVTVGSDNNGNTYICSSNCTGNPPCATGTYPGTCGWQKLNVDLSNYYDKTTSDTKYAVKSTENKFGDMNSQSTVTAFVDSKLGNLGGQTVADYVDTHTPTVTVGSDNSGNTYICSSNCTGNPPCATGTYPGTCGWQKLNVDLSNYYNKTQSDDRYALKTTVEGHTTDIVTLQNNKADKTDLNDYLKTTDAASTYLTQSGAEAAYAPIATVTTATTANTTANKAWDRVSDLGTQNTVRGYVDNAVSGLATEAYVDNKVATVRPTIQVGTYNGTTYICKTGDCNPEPDPDDAEDWEKWAPLDVNLDVLDGFGGTGEPQKVKGYIDTELGEKLDKTGIQLTREGDSINISGGGIALPYEVANVTDLMCKSYEVVQKERTDDKVTYELKCITSDDE